MSERNIVVIVQWLSRRYCNIIPNDVVISRADTGICRRTMQHLSQSRWLVCHSAGSSE